MLFHLIAYFKYSKDIKRVRGAGLINGQTEQFVQRHLKAYIFLAQINEQIPVDKLNFLCGQTPENAIKKIVLIKNTGCTQKK